MSVGLAAVAPAPRTVPVIDFEITLASGKEFQFSLRPDLGDAETPGGDVCYFTFARTGHQVTFFVNHLASISRRERTITLPAEKFEPSPTTLPDAGV